MNTAVEQQRGFVLITAMIFLIVLASLGVMALRGSLFEERMASNDRDRALAKEYAEMALRDAERDIMGLRFDGQFCAAVPCNLLRPDGSRPQSSADSNFWGVSKAEDVDVILGEEDNGGVGLPANVQGVHGPDASAYCGKPIWTGANWGDNAIPARTCAGIIGAPVATIEYGTFTDAPFIGPDGNPPQGIIRPRYLIEVFSVYGMTRQESKKVLFRITAVGFGRTSGPNGRTSVTLQTIFAPV